MPTPLRRFFEDLRRRDPQEYQRLLDLRTRDPIAFREEMMERLRHKKGKLGPHAGHRSERRQRLHIRGAVDPLPPPPLAPPYHAELTAEETRAVELAKRWKEENNPAAKSAIEKELRAALERAFEIRQQSRKVWLAELRERVAELEETIETREKNREVIIERRFRELTQ